MNYPMPIKTKAKPKSKPKKAKTKEGQTFDNVASVLEVLSGCSLHWGWFGLQKQCEDDDNTATAAALEGQSDGLKAVRILIDRNIEEWKDLVRFRSQVSAWYTFNTLPYVVHGQRLFRIESRAEITKTVATHAKELKRLADRLQAMRTQIVAWAKKRHGRAFDAGLYPENLASRFHLEWREHNIQPPSYLATTHAEEYKGELAKRLQEIQASMVRYERESIAKLAGSVNALLSACSGEGKLTEASVENVRKVLARTAHLRFEGTAVFKATLEDCKALVEGVSVEELRRSRGMKEETRQKLESLTAKYEGLRKKAVGDGA